MWHSWTDQTDGHFTSHVVHSSDCQPLAIDAPFLPDWSVPQTIPYDTLGHWTDGHFTSRVVHSSYCQPTAINVPLSKLVSNNSMWHSWTSSRWSFHSDAVHSSTYFQPQAIMVPFLPNWSVYTSNNSIRKWNPAKSEMNDFPTDLIEISVSRWFVVSFSGRSLTRVESGQSH